MPNGTSDPEREVRLVLRLPARVHRQLAITAQLEERSLNAQIIWVIRRYLIGRRLASEDETFRQWWQDVQQRVLHELRAEVRQEMGLPSSSSSTTPRSEPEGQAS